MKGPYPAILWECIPLRVGADPTISSGRTSQEGGSLSFPTLSQISFHSDPRLPLPANQDPPPTVGMEMFKKNYY